jgi:hypothetical protein
MAWSMTETLSIRELDTVVAHVVPERRAGVLGQVTDLFVLDAAKYSDDEIALFDEVIGRLAADIEVEARILLAKRLATVAKAPRNVIRTLAFDDCVEVAGPVLTHSEQLAEASLVENARTKSQQHLFAISRRRVLAEPVTDVLAMPARASPSAASRSSSGVRPRMTSSPSDWASGARSRRISSSSSSPSPPSACARNCAPRIRRRAPRSTAWSRRSPTA